MSRLTPTQRRILALLTEPGAALETDYSGVRGAIYVNVPHGKGVMSSRAAWVKEPTLTALRRGGLVEATENPQVLRITERGRRAAGLAPGEEREP